MEFVDLNFKHGITTDQLLEAINENHNTAVIMAQKIEALKRKYTPTIEPTEKIVTVDKTRNIISNKTEFDRDFEDEVEYYLSVANAVTITDSLKGDLEDILPSRKNQNYMNIVMRLRAELLRQIKDINELLIEQKDNLDLDDLREFQEEIKQLQTKMNMIQEIVLDDDTLDGQQERENTLIFVPTFSGNIRALEEIDHIDKEFYESFVELFHSIQDGSFKNVKRFGSTNNKSAGVSEVRGFQTRVVFDRIGKGEYAIITAFIKKCDSDKGYLESLELRIKNYLCQKDLIKENLTQETYIEKNKEYTKSLFDKLDSYKSKKYKRGGDYNAK